MSFIENIRQNLNANANGFFRAILLEEGVYVQGVAGIKNFSTEEIVATLKKGEIKILGENLFVKKYCQGDLVVCGKVKELQKN
jgi:hypothetical protein